MRVVCDGREFFQATSLVAGLAPARSPRPALQNVLLRAAGKNLEMQATDLEVGLSIRVLEVDVEAEGTALLPADKLSAVARELQRDRLSIAVRGGRTDLLGDGSRFTIQGQDAEDFPELPPIPQEPSASIDARALQALIGRTAFAASTEKQRYALNGVLFHLVDGKLCLVATDGKRLAMSSHGVDGASGLEVIVPTKGVQLLSRLPFGPDERVGISVVGSFAFFQTGGPACRARLACRLLEGQFPPYSQVVPATPSIVAELGREPLETAVRRASILQSRVSQVVRFTFQPDELRMTSSVPDMGESEIQIPCRFQGEGPFEIGFNPSFVLDAVKVLEGETCRIGFTGPKSPAVITEGDRFTCVIMPVELDPILPASGG